MGATVPHRVSFDDGKWLIVASDASSEYLQDLASKDAKILSVYHEHHQFYEISLPREAVVESPAKRPLLADESHKTLNKGTRLQSSSLVRHFANSSLPLRLTSAQLIQKKSIEKEISELTETIRRQKLLHKIREQNEFEKLNMLIEKWSNACIQAMETLKELMPNLKFSGFFKQNEVDPEKYGITVSSDDEVPQENSNYD